MGILQNLLELLIQAWKVACILIIFVYQYGIQKEKKVHPYLHWQKWKDKRRVCSKNCLLAFSSYYRCWKLNFLRQIAYMKAKNTAKSTSTGATTAMKLLWYPK